MFADVNGIRLYYESQGDGRPVVLVHGLGLSSDMWRYQVPALARRYRVIALDTRGHGDSSKPPGPYDMAMYIEDLRQLLDFLGFEKPVLIGLSMGGGIVQSFALAHLERVLALGLISTGSDHTDAVRAEFFHNADTVEREGMSPLIESLVPKWLRRLRSSIGQPKSTVRYKRNWPMIPGPGQRPPVSTVLAIGPSSLAGLPVRFYTSAARWIGPLRDGLRVTHATFPTLRCTLSQT